MHAVPGIGCGAASCSANAVGGINPAAVEWMHRFYGSRGKVVWLPTFESDKHVKTFGKPTDQGIVVAPGGKVIPQMEEILKIIARENLLLATGHVHPEEVVAVVKRGRELGVKNIIVTHALTTVPGTSPEQAREVTRMGAVIEICYLQFPCPNSHLPFLQHWTQIGAKQVAQAIKELRRAEPGGVHRPRPERQHGPPGRRRGPPSPR
jgi:hypothetical protein